MQSTQPAAVRMLFTLRLVFFAMIAGVLIFGGVVVFVLGPLFDPGDPTVFLAVLTLLAPVLVVAWFTVGRLLRGGLRSRLAETPNDQTGAVVQQGFFTLRLVGGAMAEGYSFFAIAVYLIEGVPIALVGAGLGLLALLVQLPTADQYQRFTEELTAQRPF